ncbi:MAG: M23 family metallopeptidase [Bacteroidales bacterium]|nr:M23 family metallopeptidase [Bacteroidales bacterium]
MKRLFFLFLIFTTLFPFKAFTQSNYPQNYFRSPIDFRVLLSGTFGELRSEHFHTGIDIKTRGVIGAKVYAVADGYVSRIKFSAFGYGKSIYLTHPNGYVTVYGHLNALNKELAAYVKSQQYKQQSFEIDLYLQKDQFVVKKGDIIAFSGNTGGSGGPHLHFEIRDEKTQEPLNPLLFGIEVKDYIRPTLKALRLYPIGGKAFNLELGGWGENYYLKQGDSIAVAKSFYLGLQAIDKQNDSENNNGVYQVELFLDSTKIYENKQERLNFDLGRYINTFIDYDYYINKKQRFQRTYVSPNNRLEIYRGVANRGVINLEDTKIHELIYLVKDANGNTSKLRFHVYAKETTPKENRVVKQTNTKFLKPTIANDFKSGFVEIAFPANSLYDTLSFQFDSLSSLKATFGKMYQIHYSSVALQKSIQLKIKSPEVPASLRKKVLIAQWIDKAWKTQTTTWENETASASIRNLGTYGLVADTMKPEIVLLHAEKVKNLETTSRISFKVKDNLSGIKNYKGFLNNKWVLFEYDAKNDLLFYEIEKEKLQKENQLRLEITDEVGNKNVWERTFRQPERLP